MRAVGTAGIGHMKLSDATPIGINVRSTVTTYAGVHDELRKIYARTVEVKRLGYKAGFFPTTQATSGALRATARSSSSSMIWM